MCQSIRLHFTYNRPSGGALSALPRHIAGTLRLNGFLAFLANIDRIKPNNKDIPAHWGRKRGFRFKRPPDQYRQMECHTKMDITGKFHFDQSLKAHPTYIVFNNDLGIAFS